MTEQIAVYCKTRFEGQHHWYDAPLPVKFLRTPHRHVFHVKLTVKVSHNDRDIEFILMKRALENYIEEEIRHLDRSCEQYASLIAKWAVLKYNHPATVDVSEDGENGATVSLDPGTVTTAA